MEDSYSRIPVEVSYRGLLSRVSVEVFLSRNSNSLIEVFKEGNKDGRKKGVEKGRGKRRFSSMSFSSQNRSMYA